MDDEARSPEDRLLSVQLDLRLDCQPISGRLRTLGGADERFVGWLGFVDALKRLHDLEESRASPRGTPDPVVTGARPDPKER
jgi:hypothetical protein